MTVQIAKAPTPLHPEVKEKWLTALRSGDYTQGRHYLATEREDGSGFDFCCLGVLCDIAVKEGVIPPPVTTLVEDGRGQGFPGIDSSLETRVLPYPVIKWAGLDLNNPWYVARHEECTLPGCDCTGLVTRETLAGENDKGATFSEIADLIEEHL